MLNIFYWYAITWGFEGVLYVLGWSDFCINLDYSLKVFLVLSVAISIVLGFIYRNKFKYKGLEHTDKIHVKKAGTIFVFVAAIIEFIYQKGIPLYSVISGETLYGEMKGVPILHTILVNIILIYSPYLFYIYLETKQKSYLLQSLLIMSVSLLMFHKGVLAFNIFIIINLAIAKGNEKYNLITRKNILVAMIVVIFLLYLNGGLTNLRSGISWNDNSLAQSVCRINKKWPSWIPLHYSWGYTYFISPLSNLSLNISYHKASADFDALLLSVLPQLFVKRVFVSSSVTEGIFLYTPILNACTGFIESVISYGYIGLWFYFIYFFIFVIFIINLSHKEKNSLPTLNYSIMSMMVVALFFFNSLKTSATALLPYIILLYPKFKSIKFCWNKR